MPQQVEAAVRERAAALCEYCHADERWQCVRFTIDHVLARAAGGGDGADNLALACFHCNRYKSSHATAADPLTGAGAGATTSAGRPMSPAWRASRPPGGRPPKPCG